MTDSSKSQQAVLTAYANILDEIRTRILGMNTIVAGTVSLPFWISAELCYLQLRMLCELVALGCLLAHGDIEAAKTKKFQGEYAADDILKRLEQLHPNFYPHPITSTVTSGGVHIERVESGYLAKDELVALYHECGGHLHRGSLSSIFHPQKPKQPPAVERALAWGMKFSNLLSQHHIASHTNQTHFLAFLTHHQANGNAFVAIAQSPELDQNLREMEAGKHGA
jgi:hypothetical protein